MKLLGSNRNNVEETKFPSSKPHDWQYTYFSQARMLLLPGTDMGALGKPCLKCPDDLKAALRRQLRHHQCLRGSCRVLRMLATIILYLGVFDEMFLHIENVVRLSEKIKNWNNDFISHHSNNNSPVLKEVYILHISYI